MIDGLEGSGALGGRRSEEENCLGESRPLIDDAGARKRRSCRRRKERRKSGRRLG
ncbi:Uncharacterized protein TCM_029718 [Theobroma cacao]|uniref:Uncharacterized protein n=1 Tax=Theobroma cacao TaxID=3641 RepID=A0A061GEN5_THECC|nr:Uncharacterized protein TCM_029718 [Theobroma cacao]